MDKKKECEIVKDLLINYVDDILSSESKKMVEEHIAGCRDCQEKLKYMKKDIKENENREQIELDYLKKIRIKTKIKAVLIAVGIIGLIVFIMFFKDFIKINSIVNKAEKSLQSNNFYKETSEILLDNGTLIKKEYYKDGKYKYVEEIYTDDGIETNIIIYADFNSDERIYIDETNKKAVIEKGDIVQIKNKEDNLKNVPFVIDRSNLLAQIGTTFVYSIETDTYDYGKEYYILKNRREKNNIWEIWIDKETGLPIKEINRYGNKSFFSGTNVIKKINDNIQEYKYAFNTVTNEDVSIPDLSNYTVENKNLNKKEFNLTSY